MAPPITCTIENPTRSHWIANDYADRLTKEEIYPVVRFDNVPRLGTVLASFSVDRYEHSSGWSDWRMYVREWFEPKDGHGIGEKTRAALNEAGRPVITAWLESPAYTAARARAVARTVGRYLDEHATKSYGVERSARFLEAMRDELEPDVYGHYIAALACLETYHAEIKAATATPELEQATA